MTTYASGRLHDHKHYQQQSYSKQAFWRDESSKKHSSIKLDTKMLMSGPLAHCNSQPFSEASCISCFYHIWCLLSFSTHRWLRERVQIRQPKEKLPGWQYSKLLFFRHFYPLQIVIAHIASSAMSREWGGPPQSCLPTYAAARMQNIKHTA